MRKTIPLSGVQGVGSDGLASVSTSAKYKYHGLRCKLTNIPLAKILSILVTVDDVEVQRITGPSLNSLNLFKRLEDGATYLDISFVRRGLLDRVQEYITGITLQTPDDMGKVRKTIRLEIQLGSALVNPAITVDAICEDAVPGQSGLMQFIKKTQIDVQGTNYKKNNLVPSGVLQQGLLDMIFIRSANLTDFEFTLEDGRALKRTRASNEHEQRNGVRTPQAGFVAIDFAEDGYGTNGDLLDLYNAGEVLVEINTSAPEACEAYIITTGRLD